MSNIYKKAVLLILLCSVCAMHKAYTQSCVWAENGIPSPIVTHSGGNQALSEANDRFGNTYVTGIFSSSTITFGSIILTNSSPYSSAGWQYLDMFLVKYDSIGNVLWAKSAFGNNDIYGESVTTDSFGNIYLGGIFESSDLILGTDTFVNAGNSDIFLAKYDSAGNLQWAKSYGSNGSEWLKSIKIDGGGNLYTVGMFGSASLILGPDTLISDSNSVDVFLVKYDSIGNVIWARSAQGSLDDEPESMIIGSKNIYVTGYFKSYKITFDSITLFNDSKEFEDIFIANYDSSGNIVWAKRAGGNNHDISYSIANDTYGNVYITGIFESPSISFGGITLNNTTGYATFLAKYNPSGLCMWAKQISNAAGYAITTDIFNNVYIGGNFGVGSIIIGPDTITNSGSLGSDAIFLAKYDAAGNFILAKGTTGTGGSEAWVYSLSSYKTDLFLAGVFTTTSITFDAFTLTSPYCWSPYLAKYSEIPDSCSIAHLVSFTDTGVYSFGFVYTGSTTGLYNVIWNFGDGHSDTGLTVHHIYSSTGSFQVCAIVYTYCGVDSSCSTVIVNSLGINSMNYPEELTSIFPNPTTQSLTITSPQNITNITITNLIGQTVYTQHYNSPQVHVDVAYLPSGIYFVKVQFGGAHYDSHTEVRKFVKS